MERKKMRKRKEKEDKKEGELGLFSGRKSILRCFCVVSEVFPSKKEKAS